MKLRVRFVSNSCTELGWFTRGKTYLLEYDSAMWHVRLGVAEMVDSMEPVLETQALAPVVETKVRKPRKQRVNAD